MKAELQKIETKFVNITDKDTFQRECSFALQLFSANAYLDKATTKSKLQAVLNIANTGLSLNPVLGFGYLVPRKNYKTNEIECHFMPGYQGLVKLLTDTGSVTTIYSQLVFKDDTFKVTLGTQPGIEHEPQFKSKDIEKVYAVAVLPDGTKQIELMTIADCHDIREMSESYKAFKKESTKNCVWVSHEGEMCRKSVIKRLYKYLPKSDKSENLTKAIELDNSEYDLPASFELIDYASSLIANSTYDDETKHRFDKELRGEISTSGVNAMIVELKRNQQGIDEHSHLSQGEIGTHIDEISQ